MATTNLPAFVPNQSDTEALANIYGPVYAHSYGAALRQEDGTSQGHARAQTFAHHAAIQACRCFLTDCGRKEDARRFAHHGQ